MTSTAKKAAKKANTIDKIEAEKPASGKRGRLGWQAEKSAMTRSVIMEAAIRCLIELGYAKTTIALIAEYADVSRGAMMHHFTSRQAVIEAVVAYLHQLRLTEYEGLMVDIDKPDQLLTKETIQSTAEAAWKYVNLPSFVAYQELLAASRTDEELRIVMEPIERDFDKQFLAGIQGLFPHWGQHSQVEPAYDLVHFMMKGMALSHMATRKGQRSTNIMAFLTDVLWDRYQQELNQS